MVSAMSSSCLGAEMPDDLPPSPQPASLSVSLSSRKPNGLVSGAHSHFALDYASSLAHGRAGTVWQFSPLVLLLRACVCVQLKAD